MGCKRSEGEGEEEGRKRERGKVGCFATTEALWCQGRGGVRRGKPRENTTHGGEIVKEEEAAGKAEKLEQDNCNMFPGSITCYRFTQDAHYKNQAVKK